MPPRTLEALTCTVAVRTVTRRYSYPTRLFALSWVLSGRGNYLHGYSVAPSEVVCAPAYVTLRYGRASRVDMARAPHRIWVWGENAWGPLTWTSLVRATGVRRRVTTRRSAGPPVRLPPVGLAPPPLREPRPLRTGPTPTSPPRARAPPTRPPPSSPRRTSPPPSSPPPSSRPPSSPPPSSRLQARTPAQTQDGRGAGGTAAASRDPRSERDPRAERRPRSGRECRGGRDPRSGRRRRGWGVRAPGSPRVRAGHPDAARPPPRP